MAYQVLARKWRPKSFEQIVGQDHVVRALSNALAQQRLHHAYLFTGTRGVGKTTLARILAKALSCETGITATPCQICDHCKDVDQGRLVDLLEIDAASNTKVDQMQDLLENTHYAPTVARFKIFIIDEVHMLSTSSFNAMLKTLEEPPPHVKFILATTDPQKLPITVLSRCLQFNLRQIPVAVIATQLENILQQEGLSFEPAAVQLVARAAAGSMRDALSLLDQSIAYGAGNICETEVRAMLGSIDQDYLFSVLYALISGNKSQLFATLQNMGGRNLSFHQALSDLALLLHQVSLAQIAPDSLNIEAMEQAQILELAQQMPPEICQLYYQIAILGRRDLGLAPDEFTGFSMSIMRMLSFRPDSLSAVTSQVNARPGAAGNAAATVAEATRTVATPSVSALGNNRVGVGAEPVGNLHAPSFDGDWQSLVDQLDIKGMVKMLAQSCELSQMDLARGTAVLALAEGNKHLMDNRYPEKLQAALESWFGRPFKLEVTVRSSVENTPSNQIKMDRDRIQKDAEVAIHNDPVVHRALTELDATIVPASIKPMQAG